MKFWRSEILPALSVAALLTAALIGVFDLGWRVAGLPFVPFDTVRQFQTMPLRSITF